MGNSQPFFGNYLVAEKDYVDVYGSVVPAAGAHPAEVGFDGVNFVEQRAGRKKTVELGSAVDNLVLRYPADGQSYKALLQRADRALYTAKSRGKNQFALYDGEMEGEQYRPSLLFPTED